MSIVLERESPPFRQDEKGAIRVGNTKVLLELVIRAFLDGAAPESIVLQYSTLTLSDTYSAIAYYLRHQETVQTYLQQREQQSEIVKQKLQGFQSDMSLLRSRLLVKQDNREA